MQTNQDSIGSNGEPSPFNANSTNMVAMQDSSDQDRHPVDLLADEFALRWRRGEAPSIEEYEQRAPEYRDMIRSLFPMIARIERVSQHSSSKRTAYRKVLQEDHQIGDFQVVREIGRGGMGIVYEAIQRSLDRRVALKVLSSGIANSPLQLQRFRREAEAAARLHHTNIVPVYGIGEENGVHFFAMQYIDGIPLAQAIETARHHSAVTGASVFDPSAVPDAGESRAHNNSSVARPVAGIASDVSDPTVMMLAEAKEDGLSALDSAKAAGGVDHNVPAPRAVEHAMANGDHHLLQEQSAVLEAESAARELFTRTDNLDYFRRVARLAAQVADALDYAHQHGVYHRDIKPSNLMVDQSGMVWIMDFGLVKMVEQQDLTQAGEIVGTLRYMAPEQLEGRADEKTDIYGLGLTLYELVTLKPAFEGDQILAFAQRLQQRSIPRPRSINPRIPRDLETIVLKATAQEPSARYATAAALAEDLRRFSEDRPILARRSTIFERFWRWSRRNPALAFASGTSIILLATTAIGMTVGRLRVESALLDAKTAQARAEKNLFSAIEAFDSILTNVTSRGLPRSLAQNVSEAEQGLMQTPLGKADALLLDRLLEFYRQFASENAENVRLRASIAEAYERAASIQLRLGRLDEAEIDYQAAISLLNKIVAADRNNVEVVVKIASLHNELGKLSLRQGDFIETLTEHLEARATLLDLPAELRGNPEVRYEMARSTDLLASIDIRSGTDTGPSPPPGKPPHDHGPGGRGGLPTAGPPGPPHSDVRSHDRPRGGPPGPRFAGMNERLRNAMPVSLQHGPQGEDGLACALKEASDELRSLTKEFPDRPAYQLKLAQGLRLQIVHAATMGRPDEARQHFLEARDIFSQLTETYPDDPKYLYELANTLTQASRAEIGDDARDSLERAVTISQQLYSRFPSATEYQLLYGTALARWAANQASRRLQSAAEQSLSRSIELLTPLATQFPDQGIIQIPLAKTCQQLGDLLRQMAEQTPNDSQLLERSRHELRSAIDRFEGYLSAPDEVAETNQKGRFNTETCASLYKSLAETLTQLQLPEQAEHARGQADRYEQIGRPPRRLAP